MRRVARSPSGFRCSEPEPVDIETTRAHCRRNTARVKLIYGP